MKKVVGIVMTVIVLVIIIFLVKNNYKKIKTGNNISNKSIDEIKEYILNIESYSANANIEIESNKTKNVYVVEQKYIKGNNSYCQKILEPENLAGMEFIYNGKDLTIKNNNMNLSKIYTNYKFVESNELSLIKFTEDYKKDINAKTYETNDRIIMETQAQQNNIYTQNKKLYIDKKNNKIEKLEVNGITQKTTIYILYNKIEINKLNNEEILAFSTKLINEEI